MELHLNRVDYIQVMHATSGSIKVFRFYVLSIYYVYVYVTRQVGVTSQKTMRLLPALGKKATQKVSPNY